MSLSFEYSWSHTWRNYGILVGFGFFFLITYLALTEINSDKAEVHPVVEFKRGTKNVPGGAVAPPDEESGGGGDTVTPVEAEEESKQRLEEVEKSLEKSLKTTDIMSWAHLTYHVSVSGGERRRLLNDISGWVVPGKLTALVGESGAGKVSPSAPYPSFPISSSRRGAPDHFAQRARSSSRCRGDHREPIRQWPGTTCGFPSTNGLLPTDGYP